MDEVMTMADVTANTQASATASASSSLPSNLPLISAFLSFALAQFLKIFTTWCVPPFLTLPPTRNVSSLFLSRAVNSNSIVCSFPRPLDQSATIRKARLVVCAFRIQRVTGVLDACVANICVSSIIRVSCYVFG